MHAVNAIAAVLLAAYAAAPLAADPQRGRVLYETHCGACHYEKLHQRKTSTINTSAALKLEVVKWASQTGRRFSAEEIDDIAEYLNQSHYRLAR